MKLFCEKCNKEHNGKYGSGRFCSSECAHSFSSFNEKEYLKKSLCLICKKEILIKKRASLNKTKCSECAKIRKRICKYCGQNKCIDCSICKKHLLFPSLIKYFGFDKNVIGTIRLYDEYNRIKELIHDEYYNNKLSLVDLAKKYNHPEVRNFYKILESLGIKRRTLSEASSNSMLCGKWKAINKCKVSYKNGWHKTWNNKSVFYRSSYELEYAKQLDLLQINYETETIRIKYWDSVAKKERIAIPDFFLTEKNTLVEIKSRYTLNKINMRDKLKAYKQNGYKIILVLDKKEFIIGK